MKILNVIFCLLWLPMAVQVNYALQETSLKQLPLVENVTNR